MQLQPNAWLAVLKQHLVLEEVSGLHTDICLLGSSLQVSPGNQGKHQHDPVDDVQCIV